MYGARGKTVRTVNSAGKRKLGELLLDKALITADQLEKAIVEQEHTGQKLGRVLVRLGFATEKDITTVLEIQLGISRAGRIDCVDPDLLKRFPEHIARKYHAAPLRRDGNRLLVAMADPTNLVAIDDLSLITGMEVEPLLAGDWEIEGGIQKIYGLPELERAFEDIQVIERNEVLVLDQGEEVKGDEAPVVKLINSIIIQAIDERASDIHIEPGPRSVRVRFRVDGLLREVLELPRKVRVSLAARVKILAELNIAERRLPQDGRIQINYRGREIDLRVSVLPTIFGEKMVIRLLDRSRAVTFIERLGFSPFNLKVFSKALWSSHGLVLVTGPTGCGKTTTLYAALSRLHSLERNIVTIEDPVEYTLQGISQCQVSEKTGFTFVAGLRAMLRQDPDIIMVGEIRDTETARIAVRAATTGHLVLSTLHTNDAVSAVARLMDMGVEPYLVGASLLAVVAQRLVRVICPQCKEAYWVEPLAPERAFMGVGPEEPLQLYRGKGCGYCNHTGFRERTAVHEVLILNRKMRQMICEGRGTADLRAEALEKGMVSLRDDAVDKVRTGVTTVDEAMRVTLVEGE